MRAQAIVFCVGLALGTAGVIGTLLTSDARKCPDVYDMALIIDACQTAMPAYCEQLERISAKCLLDRAAEAGDIIRPNVEPRVTRGKWL